MWRYLIPAVLFATLVVFFYVGLQPDPTVAPGSHKITSPLLGKPAPEFDLPTVEDPTRRVSSADFTGRIYAVNVWGTWCPGCRHEHDTLLQIAARGLIPVVGLNWKDADITQAQQWLLQLGNPYAATAYDPDGSAVMNWGVYGAPETFLVDARGIVIYKHTAPLTMEAWNREFVPRIEAARQQGASS